MATVLSKEGVQISIKKTRTAWESDAWNDLVTAVRARDTKSFWSIIANGSKSATTHVDYFMQPKTWVDHFEKLYSDKKTYPIDALNLGQPTSREQHIVL